MVGNKTNYNEQDVIRAFLLITETPVARINLVNELELGEGTIKTILQLIKQKELIKSTNKGHILTKKGSLKKKKILEEIDGPKMLGLKEYKGMKNCGLLVRNSKTTKITLDLRDEAIRTGAYSAIIFKYESELKIPFLEWNYKKENLKDYEQLIRSFNLKKGDLLIVTFAKEKRICENASLSVMKRIKKIRI
ncbi:MAG: DUF4443 domain-containing protein [Nanoarchaeota archaeon]|nr:DUF4443 domain-containing protein [Nanoarchaeota archaeon]MBU1029919.1 DUF4443 domain-containing protein [Nanoarchaeota archaeon]MBU1767981.1 DUF4443 domain-containing protein [Candidatus Omnitrophota bacterium]MBU1850519.1 DUF4443 domain-containing protein [Nanoarchaeota archaeon]